MTRFFRPLTALCLVAGMAFPALAEPRHGIAMYGEPALPPDFVSLPYANPDAPKGGRIVFGQNGSFDSLNPFVDKGTPAAGVSALTVETLMGRSYDEPFTLYGLLAESIETDEARSFMQFVIRPEARFSDGSPVTAADVLWSMEALGTIGNARYKAAWAKIATAEALDDRTVRFTFNTADRELPLILGLRPILQKAQWEGRDFAETATETIIGSGPYVVDDYEMGAFISYRRNPDWWGADLPFYRGQHNFDQVRYDWFGDAAVTFEAFKGGVTTTFREPNAARWAQVYDFPAVAAGDVVLSEIPHQRPSGITGFVMNTRLPLFADWRVRDALIHAFNFEQINATITGGVEPRITSYFSNSALGMPAGPAEGRVRDLLTPYAADLVPDALEAYALPVAENDVNRAGLRAATDLLAQAGWTVQDGVLRNAAGETFAFDILLQNGQDDMITAASIYVEALQRLGITATITTVDSAQYRERTGVYDFEMTAYTVSLSLSPGNEQTLYWGSTGATAPNTRNMMGIASPAVDALIAGMLATTDPQDHRAHVQALDRVLTTGRYVIPIWYAPVGRVAHRKELRFPDRLPLYGDWIGFQPDVWWYQE